MSIPEGHLFVRATAEFTSETVPKGLLKTHRVADGVWGKAVVLEGELGFVFEDEPDEPLTARQGEPIVIPPNRPHHVIVDDSVRFVVEFYKSREN